MTTKVDSLNIVDKSTTLVNNAMLSYLTCYSLKICIRKKMTLIIFLFCLNTFSSVFISLVLKRLRWNVNTIINTSMSVRMRELRKTLLLKKELLTKIVNLSMRYYLPDCSRLGLQGGLESVPSDFYNFRHRLPRNQNNLNSSS